MYKRQSEGNAISAGDDSWEQHRPGRTSTVPWAQAHSSERASHAKQRRPFILLTNRWARIVRGGRACYAQWEDSGPYVYDDAADVFGPGDRRPRNRLAPNAGMDVSPVVRDCLRFTGPNNADNEVDGRFVDAGVVSAGRWKHVVTTRQVSWR